MMESSVDTIYTATAPSDQNFDINWTYHTNG